MHRKVSLTLGVFIAIAVHCSNAYAVRSGYARPAELESSASTGSAFGTSESGYGRAAQSYARPAAISTGYQPSTGISSGGGGGGGGAYEYGGGSYPSYQGAGYTTGNGKRKPVSFTGTSTGNGYGGGYAPSSTFTDTGSHGGGAATSAGYTRPASVSYPSAPSVPSVPAGGVQYPSYPSDSYAGGSVAVSRPYEVSTAHVPSAGAAAGCAGQERQAGGCPSSGAGAQFPSRPVEPYDVSTSSMATPAPYDSSYGTTSAQISPRQPDGGCPGGAQPQQPSGGCPSSGGTGQFGGNGHATGQYTGNGHATGQYAGNGHATGQYAGNGHAAGQYGGNGHATGQYSGDGHTPAQYGGGTVPSTYEEGGASSAGCAGGAGEQAASGGCEQAAGAQPSGGMPKAPSTTFTRPASLGGGSGQAVSTSYSDYGSSGYTQHRTDDAYRGSAPAYPATGTDYSQPAATYNGGHANGNGYYDSSRAKDYGGSAAAPAAPSSYARPAEGGGYSAGYADRGNGWHARDSYPSQAASYSRPSGLTGGTSSMNGYARPSYDANGYGNGYAASYARSKV